MTRQAPAVPADKIALYETLVATVPGVQRKGDTVPYTSLNGHMFSYLTKSGTLALRLPEGTREAFLARYKTRLCEQYGIVQKEYVDVPGALLARTAALKPYFAASFAYVSAMKPKPTVRSRSGKKKAATSKSAGSAKLAAAAKPAAAARPAARAKAAKPTKRGSR